jgi:hypothetical protein
MMHAHSPNTVETGSKVEALFPELKNQTGLRRLRLLRMTSIRDQFSLAAAA